MYGASLSRGTLRPTPPVRYVDEVSEMPKKLPKRFLKPKTKADLDRIAAAQAKRERKARQKLKATGQLNAFENRKIDERLKAGGGQFYGDGVVYQRLPIMGFTAP